MCSDRIGISYGIGEVCQDFERGDYCAGLPLNLFVPIRPCKKSGRLIDEDDFLGRPFFAEH